MELNEELPFALQALQSKEIHSNDIISKLAGLLLEAVEQGGKEPVGIAFSGGIDSTLLAHLYEKLSVPFTLYAVGFPESKDLVAAQAIAKERGWPLKTKELQMEEIEALAQKVVKVTGKCDPVTVGVGIVTLSVVTMVEEDIVLTGLGSEELFAGYERHQVADVNQACWDGLLHIWERDIRRDLAIGQAYDKKLSLPFLDEELIRYAMAINPSLKIKDGYKKWCLRAAALELGLPESMAFRKKCAAQYGSKVDWALEKLAKKKGMQKKEYLESLKSL